MHSSVHRASVFTLLACAALAAAACAAPPSTSSREEELLACDAVDPAFPHKRDICHCQGGSCHFIVIASKACQAGHQNHAGDYDAPHGPSDCAPQPPPIDAPPPPPIDAPPPPIDAPVCTPRTCADLVTPDCGQADCGFCGTTDDGCGGTVTCGCDAGEVCGDFQGQGSFCCTPTAACIPGRCGPLGDGCGHTLDCGCDAGQVCGVGGFCEDPPPPPPAALILGAGTLSAGETIAVSGAGFAPGAPVYVRLEDTPVCTATAGADGAFAASCTLSRCWSPDVVTAGTMTIVAAATPGGPPVAAAQVQYVPPALEVIAPSPIHLYTPITIRGVAAPGTTSVPLDIDGFSLGSAPVANGIFEATVTVGAGAVADPPNSFRNHRLETGRHVITAQVCQRYVTTPIDLVGASFTVSYAPGNIFTMGFSGVGFAPGSQVTMMLGHQPLATPVANAEGRFSGQFQTLQIVPRPGHYAVSATSFHYDALAPLTIPGVSTDTAALSLSITEGLDSEPITVTGTGFTPNQPVQLWIDRFPVGSFIDADAAGAFQWTFNLAQSWGIGADHGPRQFTAEQGAHFAVARFLARDAGSLGLSPVSTFAGGSVAASGTLVPGSFSNLWIDFYDPQGGAAADALGFFTSTITTSTFLSPGFHTAMLRETDQRNHAMATLHVRPRTVDVAPNPAPPGTSSFTVTLRDFPPNTPVASLVIDGVPHALPGPVTIGADGRAAIALARAFAPGFHTFFVRSGFLFGSSNLGGLGELQQQ